MFKQEKGITLVALVITIIVLLILAGVSISLVVGDNGVLTQAQTATKKTNTAKITEAIETATMGVQGDFTTEAYVNDTSAVYIDYLYDHKTDFESTLTTDYTVSAWPDTHNDGADITFKVVASGDTNEYDVTITKSGNLGVKVTVEE